MKNQFSSETIYNHFLAMNSADLKRSLNKEEVELSKSKGLRTYGEVYLAHAFISKSNKEFNKFSVVLTDDKLVADAFKEIRKILSLKKPNKTHMSKLANLYNRVERKCKLQTIQLGSLVSPKSLNYSADNFVVASLALSHEAIINRFKAIFAPESGSDYHKAVNPIIIPSVSKLRAIMDEHKTLSNSFSTDMNDSDKAELKLAKIEAKIKGSDLLADTLAEMAIVIAEMGNKVSIEYHFKAKTFLVFDAGVFNHSNNKVKAKA